MHSLLRALPALSCFTPLLLGCGREPVVEGLDVEGWSGQCVSLRADKRWLVPNDGGYSWERDAEDDAARLRLQAADLGVYLLFDEAEQYLVANTELVTREPALQSELSRIVGDVIDETLISGGEWALEPSSQGGVRYQLHNRRNDAWLGRDGLVTDVDDALAITLEPVEGCAVFPELSVDAAGTITKTTFDDGTLYGIVDAHSHLLSNLAFGGGIYHGAAFHRLGVPHALPDCEVIHGPAGRHDFFGYIYDGSGNSTGDLTAVLGDLVEGELSVDNHLTAGYPTFPDWPNAVKRSTHQVQYYRWLERAWMAGLRLEIQHATTNAIICNFMVGEGVAPARYDCEDMTAVDRIIDETWAMQRYIDAQHGGEGRGWFRIVQSPAEAREVIAAGKLAVVLGIETSDLFDCHLTPRPGGPVCDEAYVEAKLDEYYERGVRALFPNHKYDNRFTPGDGSGDFLELGNFFNSGHWTNKTDACPEPDMPRGFDGGAISFTDLNFPRDVYLSDPAHDFSGFHDDPLDTAIEFVQEILGGATEGQFCQNGAFTDVGEALLMGMMARGMIIELDHLPAWSYKRAFEILEEHDYPAAGTHGRHWDGRIYALGGISTVGLGRCHDAADPGSSIRGVTESAARITAQGGYPGTPMGFDLNGFAGSRGPRFAEGACSTEQLNPITWPFESYAGDVTFAQPQLGERSVDFNTEGMIHIGLLPELIEDARRDAVSDADLEPLFRSAEAWIRMWELAEARSESIGG
jgi:microsomal dipeptidase-like Zn-dependent dipeptidase